MKSSRLKHQEISLKITAASIAITIFISTSAITQVIMIAEPEKVNSPTPATELFQKSPCIINSILSEMGLWISFDSSSSGTQAESRVTISDTSGITIVADFHGFWRNNCSIYSTIFDDLEMPGATYLREPGKPMLPCLFDYVEVPHDVDISIEVLSTSNTTVSGYNVTPAALPNVPVGIGESLLANVSIVTELPIIFESVYSTNAFFPGIITSTEGEANSSSLIMRGHRLLGLSFYPVQFNPTTGDLMVYSQIIVKLKYSKPAQIELVPPSRQSCTFERILKNTLANYDSCSVLYTPAVGVATSYPIRPGLEGAEYLIITTAAFESEANRLADWKQMKGIPSKVEVFYEEVTTQMVKDLVHRAYYEWFPAPTYILLLGDVDSIPTNYDVECTAIIALFQPIFESGYGWIASDLGYFTIEGQDYLPDMIYSRISVDTKEQAQTIVNKIIQYERNPPNNPSFYENILSAGYFQDKKPRNYIEDREFPFIYTLEKIRLYLESKYNKKVHINYSSACQDGNPQYFCSFLDPKDHTSMRVSYSIPEDYEWLWGYEDPIFYDDAREDIVSNINDGRFLVIYYSHGGSKNMVNPFDCYPYDRIIDGNDRDLVEGWHTPYFNTSYFSELENEEQIPLILSIACNTGWFDGETDQKYLNRTMEDEDYNPFSDYENDCFAENITRLANGGAIAAISASRDSYVIIGGHMLNGIIEAFMPGFLESGNQPITEMGAALLFGKLYAATQWRGLGVLTELESIFYPERVIRETFEEYHLLGDPETQLWTNTPKQLIVTHPPSVGTFGPQKFVVKVNDLTTGLPVDFAKVCIQQDPYVYQVGYTDPAGQVIFELTALDSPAFLNVTVTKLKYRPDTGIIYVRSSDAEVTLSEYIGASQNPINISVSGFDERYPVRVYFDAHLAATIPEGENNFTGYIPPGPSGYVNVWAAQGPLSIHSSLWEPVAVTLFYRYSFIDSPDPYIYSQNDQSTWHLAGGERVWDNPCITICCNGHPVTDVYQGLYHEVKIKVYNKGDGIATNTKVTLSYAPIGGGVSWTWIGEDYVTVYPFESAEAIILWKPTLQDSVCLKVDLFQNNEDPYDRRNNVGQECLYIMPICSPGETDFQVRNPLNETSYILIKVKQKGNYTDIWNATILGYSSQAILTHRNETVTLLIDSGIDNEIDESQLFTVEIYIDCVLIGGMAFNASEFACPGDQCNCWFYLLILAVILIAGVIYYYKRRE